MKETTRPVAALAWTGLRVLTRLPLRSESADLFELFRVLPTDNANAVGPSLALVHW